MRRWAFAVAAAVTGVIPVTARGAELAWSSAAECDRAHSVAARVEELVGRPLATIDELDFDVSVERGGDTWRLSLVTRTATGESRRALSGKSCGEVTDAAAVAMAMAVRATATDDRAASNAETAPSREPNARETLRSDISARDRAENQPLVARRASSERSLGGVVGAGAVLDTASLPATAYGVGFHGGVRWTWLRVELEGVALAPRTVTLSEGRSGEFSLLSGAALGCVEPAFSTLAVHGCAGFELGRLTGEGAGVTDPDVGTVLWSAARLEVGAGVPLGTALRLAARAGVVAPLARQAFSLAGEHVFRPPALSVRAGLGAEFLW